jgi:hypothetical protein
MKDFIKIELKHKLNTILESSIIRIENISPDADKITNTILLPYIKKLYSAINKVKKGDIDKLSSDEKGKIKGLFPKLNKRKSINDITIPFEGSLMPSSLENIYKVKKINGDEIPVSVAFFYDKDDKTWATVCGNYDTICLNINSFSLHYFNEVKGFIRHELIHIYDPKVTNQDVASKIDQKYSASTSDSRSYHKLPHEFDSWSSQIIGIIEDNLKTIKDDGYRRYMEIKLWEVLSTLNNEDFFSAYNQFKDNPVIRLFTTAGLKTKNLNMVVKNFGNYLNAIDSWKTKPTMFKTFYKRLARVVPYKKI